MKVCLFQNVHLSCFENFENVIAPEQLPERLVFTVDSCTQLSTQLCVAQTKTKKAPGFHKHILTQCIKGNLLLLVCPGNVSLKKLLLSECFTKVNPFPF